MAVVHARFVPMKYLLLVFICFSTFATSHECSNGMLYENNQIIFLDQKPVWGTLIGTNDPCDGFGGHEIFTIQYSLRLYVNFNIQGTVYLDKIDALFLQAPEEMQRRALKRTIAFVRQDRFEAIGGIYGSDGFAFLNFNQSIFFISDKVFQEGNLYNEILTKYFSGQYEY